MPTIVHLGGNEFQYIEDDEEKITTMSKEEWEGRPSPPPTMGAATPVTDLKRQTLNKYPYTEESAQMLRETPVRYEIRGGKDSRLGEYEESQRIKNMGRSALGMREQPEITVQSNYYSQYAGNEPATILGHELAHKQYFSTPPVKYSWEQTAPDEMKDRGWATYGGVGGRERGRVGLSVSNPRDFESYAQTAATMYDQLSSDERRQYMPGLYDEEEIANRNREQLAVVNPANMAPLPKAWTGFSTGEY